MTHVKSLTELRGSLDTHEQVVVVLTQPSSCVPCRRLEPHLVKLQDKGYVVALIDLDDAPWAVVEFEVQSVPRVMLYTNGEYERDLQGRTVVQLQKEI